VSSPYHATCHFCDFLFFLILKKSTCQANIMPRVRVSFLYSIWSQYSLIIFNLVLIFF